MVIPWNIADANCGGSPADGPHTIYYRFAGTTAGTTAGMYSATRSITVNLDRTAPVVSTPLAGWLTGGSVAGSGGLPVRVSWTASDVSGIKRIDLQQRINSGAWVALAPTTPATTSWNATLATGSTYRFRVRAQDKAANTGGWVQGRTLTLAPYQENHASVTYSGTWTGASSSDAYAGSTRYSAASGAKASLQTSTQSFAWVTATGPGYGTAQVLIDSVVVATIDLGALPASNRYLAFATSWSSVASHKIQIRLMSNLRVDLDAFLALK
jgi:hypothetical protein